MQAQAPPENKSPGSLAGVSEAGIAKTSADDGTTQSHGVRCFLALTAAACDSRLVRSDIACLAVILDRFNRSTGMAWPGVNRLANEAHLHRSNVMRAIQRLEALGYLKVERAGQGKSNRYRPSWLTSSADATSSAGATSRTDATELVAPPRPELVAQARPEPTYRTYPRNLPKKTARVTESSDRFDEFWAAYPRKEGSKEKVRKSWARQNLDAIADQILADIIKRKQSHPSWGEHRFILHPATYVNGQRWEDEWEMKPFKPSAADNFEGKNYVGTPIDRLPPEFRAAVCAELGSGRKLSAVERVKAANAAAEQRELAGARAIAGTVRESASARAERKRREGDARDELLAAMGGNDAC